MLEIKNAYEVLGIKEGTGKDEIVKRYNILLKRHRSGGLGESNQTSENAALEEIDKAYSLLMGYEYEGDPSDKAKKPNKLLKKLKLDEKKVNNFFYYHKYKVIVIPLVLIAVIAIIVQIVTKVEPELKIEIIGDFGYYDIAAFKTQVVDGMQPIKEVYVDPIPTTINGSDYNLDVKAQLRFMEGSTEIYILDRDFFEQHGRQGAFAPIDDIVRELGLDDSISRVLKVGEKPEQVYGIDVSGNSFLKDIGQGGKEKIIAIGLNATNYDNSVRFIKLLFKEGK